MFTCSATVTYKNTKSHTHTWHNWLCVFDLKHTGSVCRAQSCCTCKRKIEHTNCLHTYKHACTHWDKRPLPMSNSVGESPLCQQKEPKSSWKMCQLSCKSLPQRQTIPFILIPGWGTERWLQFLLGMWHSHTYGTGAGRLGGLPPLFFLKITTQPTPTPPPNLKNCNILDLGCTESLLPKNWCTDLESVRLQGLNCVLKAKQDLVSKVDPRCGLLLHCSPSCFYFVLSEMSRYIFSQTSQAASGDRTTKLKTVLYKLVTFFFHLANVLMLTTAVKSFPRLRKLSCSSPRPQRGKRSICSPQAGGFVLVFLLDFLHECFSFLHFHFDQTSTPPARPAKSLVSLVICLTAPYFVCCLCSNRWAQMLISSY